MPEIPRCTRTVMLWRIIYRDCSRLPLMAGELYPRRRRKGNRRSLEECTQHPIQVANSDENVFEQIGHDTHRIFPKASTTPQSSGTCRILSPRLWASSTMWMFAARMGP